MWQLISVDKWAQELILPQWLRISHNPVMGSHLDEFNLPSRASEIYLIIYFKSIHFNHKIYEYSLNVYWNSILSDQHTRQVSCIHLTCNDKMFYIWSLKLTDWNSAQLIHVCWFCVSLTIETQNRNCLTHWGRAMHICVGKLTIIGSDNGLSPGWRQAIVWTNDGILLIGLLGTNFSLILIEIHAFSFKKMHWKMSSGIWRSFCLGLNVLKC